jgi:formate-dependent nitrite reductase membrane component NrfD
LTAATRNRIPGSIWFTLYAISAFAMLAMGSQTGLARTRRLIQVIPLVLVFSALMTLVADLDRPAELGLIKVSQEAMISLQESMDRARP